jgi:8-amino-7-oxononanoate synthase
MKRDFGSSLYLGMKHGSGELGPWAALTTGAPAAFAELPAAAALGKAVARLQGLAEGVVAPSTLHLFWDWFGGLEGRKTAVFADQHLYRVGAWGVERAAARGTPVRQFRHHSPSALEHWLRQKLAPRRKPVVVTDGWCPFCGRAAPLREYQALLAPYGGLLVVDDTQALGILGAHPHDKLPWGKNGGGMARHLALYPDKLLLVASLAKGFGAPLAVMSGSAQAIQDFRARSETRVYGGAVSAAAIAAGKNALRLNALEGAERRRRLLANVAYFKERMAAQGFETQGGFFPVQSIGAPPAGDTKALHAALWKRGVRSVPVLAHGREPRLCWLLNAEHRPESIESACRIFGSLAGSGKVFPVSSLKSITHENRISQTRTGAQPFL